MAHAGFLRGRVVALDFQHADDVVAEIGFHHVAHRALRQFECRVVQRFGRQAALCQRAQIAAVLRRAGVLRILLGQFGKFIGRRFGFLRNFLCLLACFLARGGIGGFRRRNHDVGNAARGFLVGGGRFQSSLHFFGGHGLLVGQIFRRHHHVFIFHAGRDGVIAFVRIIIFLQFRVARLHLRGVIFGIEHAGADDALGHPRLDVALRLARSHHVAVEHLQQAHQRQAFAFHLHKRAFAQMVVLQIRLKAFGAEFALFVVKNRRVHNALFDLRVGHGNAQGFCAFHQIGALHQGLEHFFTACAAARCLRVADGFVQCGAVDDLVADFDDVAVVAHDFKAGDAEAHERNADDAQQDLRQGAVFFNCVKHENFSKNK